MRKVKNTFKKIRMFVLLAISLLVLAGGAYLYYEYHDKDDIRDVHDLNARIMAKMGFVLRDVTIEGRYHSDLDDIRKIVNVTLGMPIFAIDLRDLQERMKKLPWVADAYVVRRLPDILHIQITEYKPFAIYSDGKGVALIDKAGTVITENYLDQFKDLLVVSGRGGQYQAADLVNMLAQFPRLKVRIISAHWTGARRWTLRLDKGRQILLPEEEVENALKLLDILDAENNILDTGVEPIDLRVKGRIYMRGKADQGI